MRIFAPATASNPDHDDPEIPVQPADGESRPPAQRPAGVVGERSCRRVRGGHLAQHPHHQHDEHTGQGVAQERARAGVGDHHPGTDEQAGADHPADRDHGQMSLLESFGQLCWRSRHDVLLIPWRHLGVRGCAAPSVRLNPKGFPGGAGVVDTDLGACRGGAPIRRDVVDLQAVGAWCAVGVGRSIVVDHRRDRLDRRCRSVPFNGPRHSRARTTSSACHIAEEPLFLNTAHITPLGPLHDHVPAMVYFSLSCPAPSPPARSRHSCRTARRRSVRRPGARRYGTARSGWSTGGLAALTFHVGRRPALGWLLALVPLSAGAGSLVDQRDDLIARLTMGGVPYPANHPGTTGVVFPAGSAPDPVGQRSLGRGGTRGCR